MMKKRFLIPVMVCLLTSITLEAHIFTYFWSYFLGTKRTSISLVLKSWVRFFRPSLYPIDRLTPAEQVYMCTPQEIFDSIVVYKNISKIQGKEIVNVNVEQLKILVSEGFDFVKTVPLSQVNEIFSSALRNKNDFLLKQVMGYKVKKISIPNISVDDAEFLNKAGFCFDKISEDELLKLLKKTISAKNTMLLKGILNSQLSKKLLEEILHVVITYEYQNNKKAITDVNVEQLQLLFDAGFNFEIIDFGILVNMLNYANYKRDSRLGTQMIAVFKTHKGTSFNGMCDLTLNSVEFLVELGFCFKWISRKEQLVILKHALLHKKSTIIKAILDSLHEAKKESILAGDDNISQEVFLSFKSWSQDCQLDMLDYVVRQDDEYCRYLAELFFNQYGFGAKVGKKAILGNYSGEFLRVLVDIREINIYIYIDNELEDIIDIIQSNLPSNIRSIIKYYVTYWPNILQKNPYKTLKKIIKKGNQINSLQTLVELFLEYDLISPSYLNSMVTDNDFKKIKPYLLLLSYADSKELPDKSIIKTLVQNGDDETFANLYIAYEESIKKILHEEKYDKDLETKKRNFTELDKIINTAMDQPNRLIGESSNLLNLQKRYKEFNDRLIKKKNIDSFHKKLYEFENYHNVKLLYQ